LIKRFNNKTESIFKLIIMLVVVALCSLVVVGCTGSRTTTPKGWSGGTISGDMLVIASMEGELIAVNMTDGSWLWDVTLETAESTTGAFGCSTTTTTVAVYGSPVVEEGFIYVAGYNGRVYKIDAKNRLSNYTYLRKTEKASAWSIAGGVVVDSGNIYVGSADGCVYALDSIGLEQVWDEPYKTGDKIWATPVIDEDTLYIGSFDKNLYAIDLITGKAKWDEPFKTEGAIIATPVLYDGTVVIGSFDKSLYSLDADTGSMKWQFTGENWFWAKPVIYDDIIYAGCLDGKMYILDARTGDKLSELELGSPVSSSPVLAGDIVVVAVENGTVYGIDTGNYQIKWESTYLKEEKHKIYAALCSSGNTVFIHTNMSELHVLNTQSGAKMWSISLKSSQE
jgi:outer membrane protein assembly factor BamB